MKKVLFFSITIVFFVNNLFSLNFYSNSSGGGTWSNSASWSLGIPPVSPLCPDSIFITAPDSVYISNTIDFSSCVGPVHIVIDGILSFKTGKKLILPTGSSVEIKTGGKMVPGGGGGSSNYLEIDGNKVWTAAEGTVPGPALYTGSGLLPVTLLNFDAKVNNDKVDISWVTESELNNDYFVVEKSKDGKNWNEVLTQQGAGNSNQTLFYLDVDYKPYKGLSYYRLKQVDFNGDYTYSNITSIKYEGDLSSEGDINIFPNPLKVRQDVLKINFSDFIDQEVLIVIRDIKGQEYYSKATMVYENDQIIAVPLDKNIPAGIYLVIASSENQIYSKRIIVH